MHRHTYAYQVGISVFRCIRSRGKCESSVATAMVRIGHTTGYHLVVVEWRLVLRGGGDGEGRGQTVGWLGGDGGPGGRDGGVVCQGARNGLGTEHILLHVHAQYMYMNINIS